MSTSQPPLPAFFLWCAVLLFALAALDLANIVFTWNFPYIHISVAWIPEVIAGCLLWQRRVTVAGITSYLAAGGIGVLLGTIPALCTIFPPALIRAAWHFGPFGTRWSIFYWSASFAILVGLFFLTTSNSARTVFRRTTFDVRSAWLRPAAFIGYALPVTFLFGVAIGAMLRQVEPAVAIATARAEYGGDYEYFVTSFNVVWENGHQTGSATVIAYNDHEYRTLPVHWQDN